MAYQAYLDVLKKGVEVWNLWRINYEMERRASHLDLYGADLHSADLSNFDLSYTNLNGANLSRADLRGANLDGALLEWADLSNATLYSANLHGATLDNANFSRISISSTNFADVDLRTVKGLKTVKHLGPSTIGIDTIYRSQGLIPENFLRKAGVPETFITNMRTLVESMSPIDFYSCFISYSSKDQAFAERLYADLQSKGVRCWFAPHDMKIGDKIRHRIDESIRLYDKLLLVLSAHSVVSQWVEHEVEAALGKESESKSTVLFPVRLDKAVMESKTGWAAHVRLTRHIGDFTQWKDHDAYQIAFGHLLRDLKSGEKP